MSHKEPLYPFSPTSTARLRPGQFWSIPLKNGRFACGRVLQLKVINGQLDSRLFLAGLMDWDGSSPPTADSIAGARVIEQAAAHIKAIGENGGVVLGIRPLEADNIQPALFLSQAPGPGCLLQRGLDVLGPAAAELQSITPLFSTWGFGVIRILAEKRFGTLD